jgi:Ca2+-binding RTX toxin-like protein
VGATRLIAAAAVLATMALVLGAGGVGTQIEEPASGFAARGAGAIDCSRIPPGAIVGTDGPDVLFGTNGGDAIFGLGGDDVILGMGGNDRICGGDGSDAIEGDDDSFAAVGGSDRIDGGAGDDLLGGEGGDDRIDGGAGDDLILGNYGNDQLDGGSGEFDLVRGGPGDDVLDGGDGIHDAVSHLCDALDPCPTAGAQVDLANGTAAGDGSDTLTNMEDVFGSPFSDVLLGDGGPNTLVPAEGDDQVDGAEGDDFVGFFVAIVQADLTTGAASGEGNDTFAAIENLAGFTGSTLVGDSADNVLIDIGPAPAQGSTRAAQGGGSLMQGGPGNDLLLGEAADDRLDGGAGDDLVIGLAGDDQLLGGPGADVLGGDVGDDLLDGGPGISDAASYLPGEAVQVNLERGVADGVGHDSLVAVEDAIGSRFADVLIGSPGPNALYGDTGDDRIAGGAGNDALLGDDGDDRVAGGPGTDECTTAEGRSGCEVVGPAAARVSAPSPDTGRSAAIAASAGPGQVASSPGRLCLAGRCSMLQAPFPDNRTIRDRLAAALGGGEELGWDRINAGSCERRGNRYVITVKPPRWVDPVPGAGDPQNVDWTAMLLRQAARIDPVAFATAEILGGATPTGRPSWEFRRRPVSHHEWRSLPAQGRYRVEQTVAWDEAGRRTEPTPVQLNDRARNAKQHTCPARG